MLQFRIEKSFFLGFDDAGGVRSTRISAGSPDSGHLTTFLVRKSLPMGMNTSRLPMANFASIDNKVFMAFLLGLCP
jgi:hypothetical protein